MNDVKVITLEDGQVRFAGSQEEVFVARVESGLLVCGFRKGKAGAVLIAVPGGTEGERAVAELVRGLGSSCSLKIVGPEPLRSKAREWVSRLTGCEIAGDAEASCFEAYFYPAAGRIRLRKLEARPESESAAGNSGAKVAVKSIPARVLIVDDSKTIRNLLRQILSADPAIEVVGEAERPSQVEELIRKLKPTVITLDINMPEMDGVALLERYLPKHRIPTVMVTAISMEEGDQVLRALHLGAVDYIQKPSMEELKSMSPLICEKIKVAASIKLKAKSAAPVRSGRAHLKSQGPMDFSTVVAVGASTGGVQALESFFRGLPEKIPPIVVVQHIPPVFSSAFAKRLNDVCPFEVREAQDGDELRQNRVLIAAGGTQMSVERKKSGLFVKVFDGLPVNRHKPSVDVLFDSVAAVIGKNAIGVILTGMGADGAKGLLKMRQAGAATVAQDQDSCVVFGMPREAIGLGAAEQIKPLLEIPEAVVKLLGKRKAA